MFKKPDSLVEAEEALAREMETWKKSILEKISSLRENGWEVIELLSQGDYNTEADSAKVLLPPDYDLPKDELLEREEFEKLIQDHDEGRVFGIPACADESVQVDEDRLFDVNYFGSLEIFYE